MSSYERVAEDILYVREKEGRFPVRVEHYFPLYLIIGKGQDKKEAVYVTEDLNDIVYIKIKVIGKPKVIIKEDMRYVSGDTILLNIKDYLHGNKLSLTKDKALELLEEEMKYKYDNDCCNIGSGDDIFLQCIGCGNIKEYVIEHSMLGRGVFSVSK